MDQKSPMLRLWQLGEKEHGRLLRSMLSASVGVLAGMLPYFASAQIIIALFGGNTDSLFYLKWCGIGLAGYVIRTLLYTFALSMSHKSAFAVLKNIRERIIAKLPKLPLGTIIDTSGGQMKQTIVDQIESMETPIAHILPEMTSNLLAPIFIIIYLFVLDWRMALLSLVSLPLGMIFMALIMRNYGKDYAESVKVNRYMNETIVEYINGIEVIKAFNQGGKSYVKYADCVTANASYFYNWMKRCQFNMSLSRAIFPTTLITILPCGWLMYIHGSLSVETFITSIILSLGIAGPLLAVMNFTDSLARVGTIVGSVDSILNSEEQIHSNTKAELKDHNIVMKDVRFGYHDDKEILHGISIEIPEGSMTAFVGPSGSGKSTAAKLIAGFWDVNSGSITIGGHDLKDIPLEQLYDQVAFVSQDNYLFDDTVRENIRMGRLSASDSEVEAAAKAAGCDEFIRCLENGYDTVVGGGGAHLSGGERQRIAIARAMLKNAPIVIMDEATAYIDPENEAVIQRAVGKLVQGKTIIVIAHRLSTITDSDCIVVINNGVIEAKGTHEQLLKDSELYNSMWKAHIGAKDGDEI